jgi:WD40 repeat protein/DNA-binding SARP family transcriptional activator
MSFQILGPLKVAGESGPVAIRGPKRRALLAALLIRANRVVSSDELIGSVWGDHRPADPDAALRRHVRDLRRVLGGNRLERVGDGFVLHVRPAEFDAAAFEDLIDRARAAGRNQVQRAALLKEALGLWRGPPLAGLATELVSEPVERLNALHQETVEAPRTAQLAEHRTISRLQAMATVGVAIAIFASTVAVVSVRGRASAERGAQLARARELAATAIAELATDPERSVLQASLAVRMTRRGEGALPAAVEALHRAVLADRLVLTIHSDGSPVVRYNPDGTRLLAPGSDPGTADVYDAKTGELLYDLRGQGSGLVSHVDYSPDGRYISTASWTDGSTEIWDAHTGSMLYRLAVPSGDPVCCWEAFSPDGAVLATNVADGTVRIWKSATGRQLGLIPASGPMAFSPDGNELWVGHCVGDWRQGSDWPSGFCVPTGKGNPVTDVTWSPDGSRVATSTRNGSATIWDARTGDEVMTLVGAGGIDSVEFAPDGRELAAGSLDGTVGVWTLDPTGPRQAFTLVGHRAPVWSMDFSPDGSHLATAAQDGTVRVWNVGPGSGGEQMAVAGSGAVAYDPTGDLVAVGDEGGVELIDPSTKHILRTLPSDHGRVAAIGFDRTGTRIAVGWSDGTVRVWDPRSGSELVSIRTPAPLRAMAFEPDGRTVVTLSDDHTARVWDATTGESIHTLPRVHDDLAFSPNGELFAAPVDEGPRSGSDWVSIWDAHTWSLEQTLPDQAQVSTLAFLPDGRSIAAAGPDWNVHILEVETGYQFRVLFGNAGPIWDVAVSPDGRRMATVSAGGVFVWDIATGAGPFAVSRSPFEPRSQLAFGPDGSELLGAVRPGTVGVYALDVPDLLDVARARVTRDVTQAECRRYLDLYPCGR